MNALLTLANYVQFFIFGVQLGALLPIKGAWHQKVRTTLLKFQPTKVKPLLIFNGVLFLLCVLANWPVVSAVFFWNFIIIAVQVKVVIPKLTKRALLEQNPPVVAAA